MKDEKLCPMCGDEPLRILVRCKQQNLLVSSNDSDALIAWAKNNRIEHKLAIEMLEQALDGIDGGKPCTFIRDRVKYVLQSMRGDLPHNHEEWLERLRGES